MSGDIAAALIAVAFSLVTGAVVVSWRLSSRLARGESRFANLERRLGGLEDGIRAIAKDTRTELRANAGSSMKDLTGENNRLLRQLLLRLESTQKDTS